MKGVKAVADVCGDFHTVGKKLISLAGEKVYGVVLCKAAGKTKKKTWRTWANTGARVL